MTVNNKQDKPTTVQFESLITYPVVHKPDTTFGGAGDYRVTLVLDTPEQVQSLKQIFKNNKVDEMVLNPDKGEMESRFKLKEDGTTHVTIKRPAMSLSGNVATISVVDSKNNPIPGNILIGNGSRAVVEMFIYQNKKGKGTPRLSGIQVLDLVPYTSKTNFKTRSSGFTVSNDQLDSNESTVNQQASPF